MKLFTACLVAFSAVSCGGFDSPTSPSPITARPICSIEYRVTGTTLQASVTFENVSGGTSQMDPVAVPWSTAFTAYPDAFLYISAQNNTASGTITASVIKNGLVYKTTTSTGAYVIATASGSC
jgi:hypothetical protein